ncbi:MAG: hypothetical protein LBT04_03735 [Prevotellaceae bacterium]|jgi:hypothetical protein|nr:hypothetical protein [Prevotellaceae bacterium]
MKNKFILLLVLAISFAFSASAYADCHDAPVGVSDATGNIPPLGGRSGQVLIVSWYPTAPAGSVTYTVVLTRSGAYTIPDTVRNVPNNSLMYYMENLYNGDYCVTIKSVCPDGTESGWSEEHCFSMYSEVAIYDNPAACPGVSLGAVQGIPGELKTLYFACDVLYTVLKPEIHVVGGEITGYRVESIPFAPPYRFDSGTPITLQQDDYFLGVTNFPAASVDEHGVAIPAFKFCFYNNTYSQFVLSPNGSICFDTSLAGSYCPYTLAAGYTNLDPSIPTAWKNSIHGVLEDIDPGVAYRNPNTYPNSSYNAGVRGKYPCRALVVSYNMIPLYSCNSLLQTYQTVLYEGSGIIEVYVYRRNICPNWQLGRGVIGVVNSTGTQSTVAPGRNFTDTWTTIDYTRPDGNKPEGWRFTPLATPTYTTKWYRGVGAGVGSTPIAIGDSLRLSGVQLNDTITVEVCSNQCDGSFTCYRDTTTVIFDRLIENYDATICPGSDYHGYGFDVDPINHPGNYVFRDTIFTSAGCDSIRILKVKVLKRDDVDTIQEYCFASQDTIIWRGQILREAGWYTDVLQSVRGCDSLMFILEARSMPEVDVQQAPIPMICADDETFTLSFLPSTASDKAPPTTYKVEFDAKSLAKGFLDAQGEMNGGRDVTIKLPPSVYPDRYHFTITFFDSVNNCGSTAFDYNFDVYYPDTIMLQKFDDIIALKNSDYNGGFEFSGYQWYKNGSELTGKTSAYYQGAMAPGDKFQVKITRPDGSQMMSCPFVAHVPRPIITANPTIVNPNGTVKIFVSKGDVLVNVWTTSGVLLKTVKLKPSQQQDAISAPAREGTYLLEIIADEGVRKVQPLIVTK